MYPYVITHMHDVCLGMNLCKLDLSRSPYLTQLWGDIGSSAWLAPERISRDTPIITHAGSEIWSLGEQIFI